MENTLNLHRFHTSFAEPFDGVIVKETDTTYEYIHPLIWVWMKKKEEEDWEEKVKTKCIEKYAVKIETISFEKVYEAWMFDFPMETRNLIPASAPLLFFDTYSNLRDDKVSNRIEKTITMCEHWVTFHDMQILVRFFLEKHMDHPERIRFLFSEKMSKYITDEG